MVYTPRFEEVQLNIGNQSGCLCETSFLKAELYRTVICIFRDCRGTENRKTADLFRGNKKLPLKSSHHLSALFIV